MKSLKSAFFAFAIIVSAILYSQSAEDFVALTEFLPTEKLSSLQSEQGDIYAEMAYFNRHGYYLGETGGKDFSMYPQVSEIHAIARATSGSTDYDFKWKS